MSFIYPCSCWPYAHPYTYIQFHFPMNSFIILTAYYSCLSLCALSLILKESKSDHDLFHYTDSHTYRDFIEIIYCSICSGYEYSYQRALIMSNITISLLFTMLSICAYMSNISILLSSLAIASYTICTLITDEPFLYSYLPLIIIIYTMIPLLGRSLHSNISSLLKVATC